MGGPDSIEVPSNDGDGIDAEDGQPQGPTTNRSMPLWGSEPG